MIKLLRKTKGDAYRPVFVFGCSWRCGSTLVQRIVNSSPGIFVWGEHAGMLESVNDAFSELTALQNESTDQARSMKKNGAAAWIANLNPDIDKHFVNAFRSFMLDFYEKNLPRGKTRWGFKEVRYDASIARFLLSMFPDARIIFVARDPSAVLASNCSTHWYHAVGGCSGVLNKWLANSRSFLDETDGRILKIRYEDLLDNRDVVGEIGSFIGLEQGELDPSVLNAKVRGTAGVPALGETESEALSDDAIRTVAKEYGYSLPS